MQTASQIKAQINQIENEINQIQENLPRINATQDLLDAYSEIRNRIDVVRLLRARLATAHQIEELEQAERLEIERKRDEIQDEIEKLNAEFDTLLAPLESQLSEALPKLFELAKARQSQQSRYSELGRTLRGGSPDDLGLDRLVSGYGWSAKGEQDETKLRRLLYLLYTDSIGGAGGFKDSNRPVLSMSKASLPTPQKHTDTLGSHFHDLGL
jgi:chromosome condensin MukBEF ATPase and DNA-binding subunit MukB